MVLEKDGKYVLQCKNNNISKLQELKFAYIVHVPVWNNHSCPNEIKIHMCTNAVLSNFIGSAGIWMLIDKINVAE